MGGGDGKMIEGGRVGNTILISQFLKLTGKEATLKDLNLKGGGGDYSFRN